MILMIFLALHVMLPAVLAKIDKRPIVPIPKEFNDHLEVIAYRCMVLYDTTYNAIKNLYQLQFPDDELSKQFLYCVCYSTYLADDDGHLSELMLQFFDDPDYSEKVEKVFESCNKIKRRKPHRTLYEVVKCFHKYSPVVLGPPVIRFDNDK